MDLKRLEKHTTGQDIISRLPDDVLSHILSRLDDTKDAVKTCILSSRWKNLWTSVYNLYFEKPTTVRGSYCRIWLLNVVELVLSRCQSKNIQDFHFRNCYGLHDTDLPCFNEWICFAVERNVRSLILEVTFTMESPVIRLPQSILTCKKLLKLSLGDWDFVVDIPDSTVCFPSLKILSIFVKYPDEVLMQKLFRKCPVLEELTIVGFTDQTESVLTFDIIVPTLKTLNIYLTVNDVYHVSPHNVVVKARNLEYLNIEDDSFACIRVDETPLLHKALIVGGYFNAIPSKFEANRVMELLRAVKSTKFLQLSKTMTGVLCFAFEGNLPSFPNLIHLQYGSTYDYGWKLLPHFLNNSPNLEVLILQKDHVYSYEDDFVRLESNSVPSCLLYHVKKIQFKIKQGLNDDLKMIKYFLRNCKVLEMLSLEIPIKTRSDKISRRQIRKSPRASPSCKIKFLRYQNWYLDEI